MARKYTIHGILIKLMDGQISIEKAEALLQDKVKRTGFYAGKKFLGENFTQLYNNFLKETESDETLRIDFFGIDGASCPDTGTGDPDNGHEQSG